MVIDIMGGRWGIVKFEMFQPILSSHENVFLLVFISLMAQYNIWNTTVNTPATLHF